MNPNEKIEPLKCHDEDSTVDEDRFSQGREISNKPNYTIQSAIAQENLVSDIVAVVLAISRRQEVPSPKFASQSKIQYNILIGDQTLNPGKCARIVVPITSKNLAYLLGVDGKEMFTPAKNDINDCSEYCDLGRLRPGDVVRFNNLDVYKKYEIEGSPSPMDRKRKQKSISNEDDSHNTLLKISCEMRTSFKSLTAGPSMARLCRIIHHQTIGNSSDFQLQWERSVPISHETSKDVVLKLAQYYSGSVRPSQFTDSIYASSTTQPCQRRRIKDIVSENTMSNVLVKVLRCERARNLFATPSKSKTEQRITHATLADGHGNDDIIGISASARLEWVTGNTPVLPKGISETLLQAMSEGKFVLLTNVASRSVNPMTAGKENLGLVPTSETTATMVRPEHPYYLTPQKFQRSNRDAHTSQPLLSLTQDDSPEKKDRRYIMAIEATLIDIIVDGMSVSLVEGAYWEKPRALSNFLINRPSISTGLDAIKLRPSYRTATLLLDAKVVSREVSINADSNALKLLCMDVPIEDMIFDDYCNDVSTHPYLLHVGRMLQSLCEDDVRIRWVLEQEDECNWFVTNATLLEI